MKPVFCIFHGAQYQFSAQLCTYIIMIILVYFNGSFNILVRFNITRCLLCFYIFIFYILYLFIFFTFGEVKSLLCYFFKFEEKIIIFTFDNCVYTKSIWNQIQVFLFVSLEIRSIILPSTVLVFLKRR